MSRGVARHARQRRNKVEIESRVQHVLARWPNSIDIAEAQKTKSDFHGVAQR